MEALISALPIEPTGVRRSVQGRNQFFVSQENL
jgi:hypothetical protein